MAKVVHQVYDLRKIGLSRIIAINFPAYERQARTIAFDGVYDLIVSDPKKELTKVYVDKKGKRAEMKIHCTDEDGRDDTCAIIGLKEGNDALSVFRGTLDSIEDFSFFKKFKAS